MARTLVLNATHEPLCVVSDRRAVVLVYLGKADPLLPSGTVFHSADAEIEVPSVIRLRTYVRVPYRRRSAVNRRAVLVRDDHTCQYCGDRADSVDHVVPRARGGEHTWDNVVAACRPCNTRKRDRLLHETPLRLRRRPVPPHHHTWVRLALGRIPADWEQFLEPPVPVTAQAV